AHLMTDRHRGAILRDAQVTAAELQVEVEARYAAHKDELLVEPRFTFRQVLVYVQGNPAFPDRGMPDVKARAKVAKALAALRRGTSWEEVVKTYSDDSGSNGKGLIRDGRFGYFAREVESAIRTQPLGQPGQPFRSMFGYHVIEVVDRILAGQPKPFDEVKGMLEGQWRDERAARARVLFMTPIQAEIGLHITLAGESDSSLLDGTAMPADALLATVGRRQVREADFQWFLKDAWLPGQRVAAYARPGTRQGMLGSFLDTLVLEAKARKEGLQRSNAFLQERAVMEERLLVEFMRERDKMGAHCDCGNTEDQRRAAWRRYFDRTRAEVDLVTVANDSPR
ncbi:MAG TPA: peptidylprolyl isomerase, partial [Polyangia bacterium]